MNVEAKPLKRGLPKRLLRIAAWLLLGLVVLFLLLHLLFRLPAVQAYTAEQTARWLSKNSGTSVQVDNAKFRLFSNLALEGFLIEEYNGQDTILFADELVVNMRSFNPLGPKIFVRDVLLRDASFNMRRVEGDSLFSFVRFLDAIVGGGTSADNSTDEAESKKKSALRLELGGLKLENVHYTQVDINAASDFSVHLPTGAIAFDELNVEDKVLRAKKIALDGVKTKFWKDRPFESDSIRPDSIHLTTGGWTFVVDKLALTNAGFIYDDFLQTIDSTGALDFAHLDVQSINIELGDVRFVRDTITGNFLQTSFFDHSGFRVKQLNGAFYVSNEEIVLDELLLETANSLIQDRFSMYYGDFTAFSSFWESVRMESNFSSSKIALSDIAYFAPDIASPKEVIYLDGRVYGTIDNLKGREIVMGFGRNSKFEGRMDINGLPDLGESFISFQMKNLRTNSADIYALVPDLELPVEIEKLGTFAAQGEFTGFPRDFVAYGNLQSAIGDLSTDVNMKINDSGLASYSGNLELASFDLGNWTGQDEAIGLVSLTSEISGTGLTLDELDVKLNTSIDQLELNDYSYSDLKFNGIIRKDFFEGALVTADPGFDQNFEGTIDFSSKRPVFQFTSKINGIDLQAMNLTNHPLTIKGEMKLNLEGNHVDSILGKAALYDLVIVDSSATYILDSLSLIASEENNQRSLRLNTELFSAAFTGDFVLSKMPDAIKDLIGHYFPGSGIRPDTTVVDQDLLFAVSIKDSKNFTQLISPEIGRIKNSNISGSFNSARRQFDTRAKFPEIEIGDQKMENFLVDIKTDNNQLNFFAKTNRVFLTDSLYTPITVIEGNYARDSLFFNLFVGRDTDPDRVNLKGAVTSADESFRFNILPSQIYTKDKKWEISPNNTLVYNYKSLIAQDFMLTSGEQIISLTSSQKKGYNSFLELDLTAVKIEDIFHSIRLEQFGMAGSVDGRISVGNIFDKPGFLGNLAIKDFYFNDILFGDIKLNSSLQSPQNRLNFIASVSGANEVVARGGYFLVKGDNNIDAEVAISKLSLSPFENFLAGVISDLSGDVSGDLKLSGEAIAPDINGELLLTDGAFTVEYLGVPYRLPSLGMSVSGDSLILEKAILYDPENNPGYISNGGIHHEGFSSWWFDDITLTTPNMLFMDNNREMSPEFYGTAYGTGAVEIDGPLSDLDIIINAQSNRGTSIAIPIYGARSVAGNDFINFVNIAEPESTTANFYTSKVNFSLYLDVTEDALVELDIGDKLIGRGNGNLHLEVNTLGDIRMTGLYSVAQGTYSFSLQDLISKEFEIEKGGTISWTGDPYAAVLDLRAIYKTRASAYDLLDESVVTTLSAEEQRKAQKRQDVLVFLELSGLLESPNIDFDIEVPNGQNAGISLVDRELQEIEADKSELNRQVFGLLVFNRFIPDQSGFTPLFSGASTSVSEFLSKQLSGYFSDWLSQYVTDLDVNIGYRTYADNLSELGSEEELEVDLSKKFFDDRIFINLGGNFDIGNNDAGNSTSNGNVAGDFQIEYAITPDGRFRIRAFQRTDYDVAEEKNYIETGVGVFYSQEFNSLYELVANRKQRRRLRKLEKTEGESSTPANQWEPEKTKNETAGSSEEGNN